MRPDETIPGIVEGRFQGGRGDKGEWQGGVNSIMMDLIHCKNFGKWHNVPPAQQ
jgi:hypothetical protein